MDKLSFIHLFVPYSQKAIICPVQELKHTSTSARLLMACQITHSVVAGSVDNVNLLEVPVQEVSADGQDITATTVVLLHRHRLGQARARHRCATGGWRRCKEETGESKKSDK